MADTSTKELQTRTVSTPNGAANETTNGTVNGTHHNGFAPPARSDAPDHGRYVTLEEYWETYYDHVDASYEWNNGYLEAKPLSTPVQFQLYKWFFILLEHYLTVYQNAQMMALETGFTMRVPDDENPGTLKKTVRKPDIAAIRYDNKIRWGDNDRSYKGICDLCIESMSDSAKSEIERDTKIKKAEYEFAGAKEYYILDPDNNHMHFYYRNAAGVYEEIQPDANGVIHSRVLEGFRFRLTDLDRLPPHAELAVDEVYQHFVMLEYQAEKARADAEAKRADTETKRANAEAAARTEAEARADAEAAENALLRTKLEQLLKNASK